MTDRDSATSPPGEGNDLTLQTNVGRLRASYSAWNREGDIGAIVDQLDPEIEFQAFRDESPEGRTFFEHVTAMVEEYRMEPEDKKSRGKAA